MTALEQLEQYLAVLERRLRIQTTSAGVAITVAAALLLTLALTWFADLHRFAPHVVLPLRILLFAAVAFLLTFLLAIPVARLNRRRVTQLAESRILDFQQRLLTVTERPDATNPFTELLAEESLRVAREHGLGALLSPRILYASLAGAIVSVAILCWMIVAGPGIWGYGASLLWTGTARANARPLYDVAVQPGNTAIRRKSDQIISAQLIGFTSHRVVLHARYDGALKWDELQMTPQPNGNGYQLLFPGLSDSLEYYVQAGETRSKQFVVRVKDLAAVKRVRVAIHYPSGIGLKDIVDDPGGDIRAVEGSRADVSILTDRPLEHGLLVLEDGSTIPLKAAAPNWTAATLPIVKDSSYHVAVVDSGQSIRISEDYFIEAKKDEPPSVRILQPGPDPHVSPIEEVPVTVDVADDFGVRDVDLHYSLNGGPDQVRPLLKTNNVKESQLKTTLSFEDFKLAPGDLVSFYATARDGSHTSRSDMVFAQAEPFDFKFRQSQQAGGGGGGGAGNESGNISARQKEIIAATWNEVKDAGSARATAAQNAQFLSGMEGKLGEQAKALAQRMGNRDLVGSNPEFDDFSKAMLQASASMAQAVGQLGGAKWTGALPPEQQALQSLLHAESIFRDIQVAFGQSGGGGMNSGGQDRELARLFDLELDTSKNQYETGQSPAEQNAGSGADQQKKVDDALQRLKDLAKRQQDLAQQPRSQQQEAQQRWEQEQLRREAEQLRQQMQQLAQNGQAQASQARAGQAQNGQKSQSGAGQMKSAESQNGTGGGAQRAVDQLRRAEDEMRTAAGRRDPASQRRAAGQLAAAQQQLQDLLHNQAGNSLAGLAGKARELAAAQRELANKVKSQYGAAGVNTLQPNDSASAGGSQMPEMNGPGFAGGWRRRRLLPIPDHPATKDERAFAAEGEKLARQIEELQTNMQAQAQGMQTEQPDATRKLRKALSDAEQQELAVRMRKNSEWLRDGYGSQTWPMEDSITAGTEQLAGQLHDAEQALANANSAPSPAENDKLAQALAEVQSLREQLQTKAPQHTQGQSGESSQGTSRQPSEDRNARTPQGNAGGPTFGGGAGSADPIRDLNELRAQLGRDDRQLNGYFNDALGGLRRVNAQSGLLDARLTQDAINRLGRLELELARRLGQQNDGARTGSPENAPEAYRQAVATYFRTLSQ